MSEHYINLTKENWLLRLQSPDFPNRLIELDQYLEKAVELSGKLRELHADREFDQLDKNVQELLDQLELGSFVFD